MIEKLIAILIVALVLTLILSTIWIRHERRVSADLREDVAAAERQIAALRINREVLNQLDQGQREVTRQIEDAKRQAETVEDAVDWIEKWEGR